MNKAKESKLHPRNRNCDKYDLAALLKSNPELSRYIKPNKMGEDSVDFANPKAVKELNKALLNHYYGIQSWDFPAENLCPPIPGRADYIHYMADLLAESNLGQIPMGNKITCFDVGTGASCIYPILGVTEYNWQFIASDIEPKSIASAQNIVKANPSLTGKIDCRLQTKKHNTFLGVIEPEEKFDISICNPPFHASAEAAQKGTERKVKNLSGKEDKKNTLNFAGLSNELICDGGEYKFIHNMIKESRKFAKNCFWFTSLVSKQSNLKSIYKALDKTEATEVKTINMGTGNKSTRIVAWTFLTKEEQKAWVSERWK